MLARRPALALAPLLALLFAPRARAANDGLALLPPMGWRSWSVALRTGRYVAATAARRVAAPVADRSSQLSRPPELRERRRCVDLPPLP